MAKSIIRLIVEGDTRGAQRALKDAQNEAGKAGSGFKEFGKVAGLAFAGAGAVAVEFGRKAVSPTKAKALAFGDRPGVYKRVKAVAADPFMERAWAATKEAAEAAVEGALRAAVSKLGG